MYRSKLLRILSTEYPLNSIFHCKNPKYIYTNCCQCMRAPNFILQARPATLTSNTVRDTDTQITEKLGKLKDKDFLANLKNDPDTFGTQHEEEYIDEGDMEEERYISERPLRSQKLSDKKYADIIKALIRKRKIKEAIDVVEVRMIKEDRVKPAAYIYNLIIGACGRVGYTKKAFMLYNDMKRRGLSPMGGTYTALFNACSNSPWPLTDGLTRAKHLHEIMKEKSFEPNETTYNAMIKAFGRCGDIATAFFLVDEMIYKKIRIRDDTFTFLLQACISDTEAGFRHALLVWRKLIDKKIWPSIYNYNTLLRCIRDCGLGDIETTKDVINKILSSNKSQLVVHAQQNLKLLVQDNVLHKNDDIPLSDIKTSAQEKEINQSGIVSQPEKEMQQNLTSHNISNLTDTEQLTESQVSSIHKQTQLKENVDSFSHNLKPNLIATVPYLGSLISLSEVKRPEDRLLLVGGFKGFLEDMAEHNCKPDIKTFTQLLDCIPGSLAAEQELLSLLPKYGLKPDLDFYNMLMKKRSLRGDYEGAKVKNSILIFFSYFYHKWKLKRALK